MKNKKVFIITYWFVVLSFILPIVFTIYKVIVTTPHEMSEWPFQRSRADYTLMLLQCILGLCVINMPSLLSKRLKFEMPLGLYLLYIIFLYCAIFLGEIRNFYYTIPHWDDILHGFSSMMTGFFGFMCVEILNRQSKLAIRLSPVFVALFAFCFSITIGAMWEIYEFLADGIFGLNMQKFITEEGIVLSGHDAVSDTMRDIIVDTCGAFVSSVVGYLSIKNQKGWIHDFFKKNDV